MVEDLERELGDLRRGYAQPEVTGSERLDRRSDPVVHLELEDASGAVVRAVDGDDLVDHRRFDTD